MRSPVLVGLLLLAVLIDVTTPDPHAYPHACRYGLAALILAPCQSDRSLYRRAGQLRPVVVPTAPVELQLCKDRWQEHLQPGWLLRVWHRGTGQLVAELPVQLVEQLIGHYLTSAGLTAAVLRLQDDVRRPLASAPARTPLRALGVPLRPVQEARRAARAARKNRP